LRARTSASEEPAITRTGWYSAWNCGTPKSNSPVHVESPTTVAAATTYGSDRPSVVAVGTLSARPSRCRSNIPSGVREAPEIITRWVGPHIVTSIP
jgi:hypothetical protein